MPRALRTFLCFVCRRLKSADCFKYDRIYETYYSAVIGLYLGTRTFIIIQPMR